MTTYSFDVPGHHGAERVEFNEDRILEFTRTLEPGRDATYFTWRTEPDSWEYTIRVIADTPRNRGKGLLCG